MVVLLPLFEGEELRRCSGCPHLGLASPIKPRTSYARQRGSFRGRCRFCIARQDKVRKYQKQFTDPDYIHRKRQAQSKYSRTPQARAARKRYLKRRAARLGAEAIREENRLAYGFREERLRGRSLPTVINSRYRPTGVMLEAEPFISWLRRLVRYEEGDGWIDSARARVAANLQIDESYLGKLLKGRKRPIDESIIDAAISRHGRASLQEIYKASHMVIVPGEDGVSQLVRMGDRYTFPVTQDAPEESPEESFTPKPKAPRICKDPQCTEVASWSVHTEKKQVLGVIENGGPFCRAHAERLARIRAELEGNGALMASCGGAPLGLSRDRAKVPSRPTCCAQGCANERLIAERFCDSCQSDGWVEEACE